MIYDYGLFESDFGVGVRIITYESIGFFDIDCVKWSKQSEKDKLVTSVACLANVVLYKIGKNLMSLDGSE